jgi:hypothetical protein
VYVEKRRVAVRVSQSGHDPVDGYFCLAIGSEFTEEPQTVLELLNSPLRVIPFILEEDGSVILLTRQNLDWVVAGEQVEPELMFSTDSVHVREEPVELQFMTGTTIDGLMQIGTTDGSSRASDFLNAAPDFYPVITRLGTLLVNKTRVRETRLSTISPHWARDRQSAASSRRG